MLEKQHYLNETEDAMRHLFASLEHYATLSESRWGDILDYWDTQPEEALAEFVEKNQTWLKDFDITFGSRHSVEVLSGSVIQIAFQYISLYVPPQGTLSVSALSTMGKTSDYEVAPNHKVRQFDVGREIHGIRLGLLLYAARNQYNHLEDGNLRPPSSTIFDRLARNCGRNERFDLTRCQASAVLFYLAWHSFDAYMDDMAYILLERSA